MCSFNNYIYIYTKEVFSKKFCLGIIGPGLLVGSGSALSKGGPAGILISFLLVGIVVFNVMYVCLFYIP